MLGHVKAFVVHLPLWLISSLTFCETQLTACSPKNVTPTTSSPPAQGCIFCLMCSHSELTKDHVLTSVYVKIFRTVTRNAVNKSVWRKKYCFWLPLNKHAMNIWLSSLRIRAHLSWRTGKHLHVLRTYSTCSYPGYQDTTTYAALNLGMTLEQRLTLCKHWTSPGSMPPPSPCAPRRRIASCSLDRPTRCGLSYDHQYQYFTVSLLTPAQASEASFTAEQVPTLNHPASCQGSHGGWK